MTVRALRVLLGAFALVVIALIIWVDLATDLWQKYVIISGLAGGLITFVLTTLVVERIIARADHERWEPVTHLALGDLRRRLAEEPGTPRARRLPDPRSAVPVDSAAITALLETVDDERDLLIASLARWSAFLSSSADVTEIMDGIAQVALRLDAIDNHARELRAFDDRSDAHRAGLDAVRAEIIAYHGAADTLVARIDTALCAHASGDGERIPA